MKRRIFPAILALCLILTLFPVSAMAEEETVVEPPVTTTEAPAQEPTEEPAAEPTEGQAGVQPAVAEVAIPVAAAVAKIGETTYESLQAAVTAAQADATIILLAESTLTASVDIGVANLTLNMNGQTLNTGGYALKVNSGALTVTGNGSVINAVVADNPDSNLKTMFRVYPNGSLTIKNGTYDTKAAQIVYTEGKILVESGTFTCSYADQAAKYDGKCIMVAAGASAELTILGGTLTATEGTDYCGMNGVYALNGATIILGDENTKTGPTIHTNYSAIGANNTTATTNVTIYGGRYIIDTDGDASNDIKNKFNTVLYMPCNGKYNISGGTFVTNGKNSHVFSLPYANITLDVKISGGDFSASGDLFYFGTEKPANNPVKPEEITFAVTGGTFSQTPNKYVADGYIGVKGTDNKFVVKTYANAFAPTLDLTKAGGVTANNMALTGTVDPRTYTVTDTELQRLFADLLTESKPIDNVAVLAANAAAKFMYIKDNKQLSFGILKFANIDPAANYVIQQVNPALGYAYGTAAFPNNTKLKIHSGANIVDGLAFMISSQPGNITFKIAPVAANAAVSLPANVATYTITNGVTFTASEKPADTTVEVPVDVVTSGGTVTAKAEAGKAAVESAVSSAGTTGTVTIEATTSNTSVNAVEVTLTKDAVSALATGTVSNVKEVALKTPVGTVTLSDSALTTIAGASGVSTNGATVNVKDVSTTVTGSVKAFEVKVTSNSTPVIIGNLINPIKLSFNVGTDLNNPVLMFVDTADSNKLKPIKSSSYDSTNGIITGETSHLSTFAVVDPMAVEAGGIGCKVTLTATAQNQYLTIQVTNGNANSIYTVKATDVDKKVVIYVKSGTVLNVWETSAEPTFANGSFTPGASPNILVDNQTVTTP